MAFYNTYRHTLNRDGTGEKGATCCILPFFGFSHGSDSDTYTQGVYISDSDTLSGQRKVYGTHSVDVEVFSRSAEPTGKALELENKFIALVKKNKGMDDPWKMPYVPTSMREYYDSHVKGNAVGSGCVLSIAAIILWFVFYNSIFPLFEAQMDYDSACVAFVFGGPIVLGLLGPLGGWIFDLIRKARKTAPPEYWEMTPEQREAAKKKYFDHMTYLYGAEAGEVLKEYAILKGYVR